jgi:UDP:flavonoid glycosyltransferase YjiC (YdhE family)
MSKRIVLSTFGSFGDVHPSIALALELKRRGHRPVVATSEFYREKMDAAGVELHPVRPDDLPSYDEPERMSAMLEKMLDQRTGTMEVMNRMVLPYLRASYDDLSAAARGADLLVTHPLPFVGPVVAEKTGVAWVSTVLAPASLLSRYDPPAFPQLGPLNRLVGLHPLVMRALMRAGRWVMRDIERAVNRLRADVGLGPAPGHPFMEGQYSPRLNLALFSTVLAQPQPDWPANTHATGFPFYDRRDYFGETSTPRELLDFLDSGPPPVVFTLGSAAVYGPGSFYRESAAAARAIGRRAVLLVGPEPEDAPGATDDMFVASYAPYSELFPRVAAVVHQGGIGTTAQALRAGRPMVIVPFSHDQPDNAARMARLGVAATIARTQYTAARAADALRTVLNDPAYRERASRCAAELAHEDGAAAAAAIIEQSLTSTAPAANGRN